MQEHQKVTEQIQMWRMVETLQNKSTIGFYKARQLYNQDIHGQPGIGGEDAAYQVDYLQPKDMTTIMEEQTAMGDLTLTENSMMNNSVDNDSSATVRRIKDQANSANREHQRGLASSKSSPAQQFTRSQRQNVENDYLKSPLGFGERLENVRVEYPEQNQVVSRPSPSKPSLSQYVSIFESPERVGANVEYLSRTRAQQSHAKDRADPSPQECDYDDDMTSRMLRSEYRKGKRHARISSCSKKDMDYHLEAPYADRLSPTHPDLASKAEPPTAPTAFCPTPFCGLLEEQDLLINTNSSQDIPNEQSSCRSAQKCAMTLTQYSTPKMTAMDEEVGDDAERRKPAETMEFSLVNRVNAAAAGKRPDSPQDDELKTMSTP